MRTLSEAMAADGVTLTYTSNLGFSSQRRVFHGTFQCEGRTLKHTWSQSYENRGLEPSAAEIMSPAIMNAMTVEAADDYEDWAGDFDMDPANWPDRDTYESWLDIAKGLRKLLGDERYESYSTNEIEHDV